MNYYKVQRLNSTIKSYTLDLIKGWLRFYLSTVAVRLADEQSVKAENIVILL